LFLPQKVVTAGGIETAEATVNINNRVGYAIIVSIKSRSMDMMQFVAAKV
tara:strand:- start:2542 stop:2691 length:150 start_codon:yes stop_codon:yes gene_type:complete